MTIAPILSRVATFIAPVAAMLLSVGCSGNPVEPEDLTASIEVPEDWVEGVGSNIVIFIGTSPVEDGNDAFQESVNIVVEEYPDGWDFDQYVSGSLLSLSTILADYSTITSESTQVIDRRAQRIVYTGRLNNHTAQNLLYIIEGRDRAWLITCSATPESFDRWLGVFEGIVDTFRLE